MNYCFHKGGPSLGNWASLGRKFRRWQGGWEAPAVSPMTVTQSYPMLGMEMSLEIIWECLLRVPVSSRHSWSVMGTKGAHLNLSESSQSNFGGLTSKSFPTTEGLNCIHRQFQGPQRGPRSVYLLPEHRWTWFFLGLLPMLVTGPQPKGVLTDFSEIESWFHFCGQDHS